MKQGTDAGIRITIWDDRIRYVLIPALAIAANCYSTKVLIYSRLLVIGLILRFVMRHWTETFRQLAVGAPNEARANCGRCSTMSAGSSAAPAMAAARSHVLPELHVRRPVIDGPGDR